MSEPCLSLGDLAEYWTADVSDHDVERIEAHVFGCADCARQLAEAETLARGIAHVARAGTVSLFVTDSVLNRLAHDGVRLRSYTVEPGTVLPCTVWADDEIVVTRLRADFTGVDALDAVMRLDAGPGGIGAELTRADAVPVQPGAREMIMAIPASAIRALPEAHVRLTLTASSPRAGGATIAEYVFDHRGAHARAERR